jgi:hypothetical protein
MKTARLFAGGIRAVDPAKHNPESLVYRGIQMSCFHNPFARPTNGRSSGADGNRNL